MQRKTYQGVLICRFCSGVVQANIGILIGGVLRGLTWGSIAVAVQPERHGVTSV